MDMLEKMGYQKSEDQHCIYYTKKFLYAQESIMFYLDTETYSVILNDNKASEVTPNMHYAISSIMLERGWLYKNK